MKRFLPFGAGLLVVVLTVFAYIPKVQSALGMRQAWRAANPELAALQDQLEAQQDSLRAWDLARERLLSLEVAARLPRATATLAFSADANTLAETREALTLERWSNYRRRKECQNHHWRLWR